MCLLRHFAPLRLMTRITPLNLLILLCLPFGYISASETRPNIVFIMADDLGYSDIGAFGATDIDTPHIDSLARDGAKFTSFYVHPRCTPTRAALMTGTYANRINMAGVIYANQSKGLNPDEVTVAELLKEQGYRTGMVGKWHLGDHEKFSPLQNGFETAFYKRRVINDVKMEAAGDDIKLQRNAYDVGYASQDGPYDLAGRHQTDVYTEHAVKFIKDNQDRPFFLYFAHNIPHVPLKPSKSFEGSSQRGQYGDVVQEMDHSIGIVLQTLKDSGLSDNTLVIFCSDNGPQYQYQDSVTGGTAQPLRDGKWSTFEGGTRTPFVARWPGKIRPGSVNESILGIIDMLPTFAALAEASVPHDRKIDGIDQSGLFTGEMDNGPRETFAYFDGAGCFAYRYKDWKLFIRKENSKGTNARVIETGPVQAGALFNLKEDISESKDLSAEYPEIKDKIQKMADAFVKEYKANKRPAGSMD